MVYGVSMSAYLWNKFGVCVQSVSLPATTGSFERLLRTGRSYFNPFSFLWDLQLNLVTSLSHGCVEGSWLSESRVFSLSSSLIALARRIQPMLSVVGHVSGSTRDSKGRCDADSTFCSLIASVTLEGSVMIVGVGTCVARR